jgi:hypothetical protein
MGVPAGQPTNGADSRVTSAASTVTRGESSGVGPVGLSVAWLPLQAVAATNAGRSKTCTQFEKPACIAHLVGRGRSKRHAQKSGAGSSGFGG